MNLKYYKTDRLIALIIIASLIITPISSYIEKQISTIELLNSIYSYIGTFSTISILTLLLFTINNFLWKIKALRWLVDLPDLNGRYEGELISTFNDSITGQSTKKKCVIEITQNASRIKIHSYYGDSNTSQPTSESTSVSEEILQLSNGIFEVFYIFTNSANTLETQLDNHIGTCHLKYFPDNFSLTGEYYNKRGYKGTINVKLTQKNILGRLNQ